MNKNKLVINIYCSNGEYAKKLGVEHQEGFHNFIGKLHSEDSLRLLSGVSYCDELKKIADLFQSFDEIIFDDDYRTHMQINDWDKLQSKCESQQKLSEFKIWVYRGMITDIVEMIDVNIRYQSFDVYLDNLRDFLSFMYIKSE